MVYIFIHVVALYLFMMYVLCVRWQELNRILSKNLANSLYSYNILFEIMFSVFHRYGSSFHTHTHTLCDLIMFMVIVKYVDGFTTKPDIAAEPNCAHESTINNAKFVGMSLHWLCCTAS